MSKQLASKDTQQTASSYLSPHVQPRIRSHIVPKVISRIQPKLMINRQPKHHPLEQEADEMGKRASEGKEANVILSADGNVQKKEEDPKIIDKGKTKHAKGKFDITTNAYTVPDASVYDDPQQAFDTLYSISVRFGVTIETIKKANSLLSDAVIPGQILIIPAGNKVREEPKPVKREIKQIPNVNPKPAIPQKQESATALIEKYTSYSMLNEEALANELVKNYLFSNPVMVSEVLKQVEEWNEDDVVVEILKLVSENNWKNIDRKLLSSFKIMLHSGFESDEEKVLIDKIDGVLNRVIEKPIPDIIKTVSPVKTITSDTSTVKPNIISATNNVGPEKEPYASQMDNKYHKRNIYGDTGPQKLVTTTNTCNVTSLAMALRRVESNEVLKNNVISILIQNGGYTEEQRASLFPMDLEDLIMHRFEQAGTNYFLEPFRKWQQKPQFEFPRGNGVAPHQFAFCLNYIGNDILSKKSVVINKVALSQEAYVNEIKPFLDKGYGAFMGTDLTGSGHVVSLESVKGDGIVINDPYGILVTKQGEYIVNGRPMSAEYKKYFHDNPSNMSSKLKYNSKNYALIEAACKEEDNKFILPHTIGEKVFFTWTQVKKYNIGFWLSLINKDKL